MALKGRRSWLLRWAPVAAGGGAIGATLLLSTPAGVFARVVPFLVAAGSFTLLAQPKLAARRERRQTHPGGPALPAGLVAVSLYNGYFGAGSGVMALALILVTVDGKLAKANALKNMLIGAATVASAIAFTAFGPVDWPPLSPSLSACLLEQRSGRASLAACPPTSCDGPSLFSAWPWPSSCSSDRDRETDGPACGARL